MWPVNVLTIRKKRAPLSQKRRAYPNSASPLMHPLLVTIIKTDIRLSYFRRVPRVRGLNPDWALISPVVYLAPAAGVLSFTAMSGPCLVFRTNYTRKLHGAIRTEFD